MGSWFMDHRHRGNFFVFFSISVLLPLLDLPLSESSKKEETRTICLAVKAGFMKCLVTPETKTYVGKKERKKETAAFLANCSNDFSVLVGPPDSLSGIYQAGLMRISAASLPPSSSFIARPTDTAEELMSPTTITLLAAIFCPVFAVLQTCHAHIHYKQ